jgi:hypothetical protein
MVNDPRTGLCMVGNMKCLLPKESGPDLTFCGLLITLRYLLQLPPAVTTQTVDDCSISLVQRNKCVQWHSSHWNMSCYCDIHKKRSSVLFRQGPILVTSFEQEDLQLSKQSCVNLPFPRSLIYLHHFTIPALSLNSQSGNILRVKNYILKKTDIYSCAGDKTTLSLCTSFTHIYNYSTTSGSGTDGIYNLRCLLLDHLVTTQTLANHKTGKAANQLWETLTDMHRKLYWFWLGDQGLKLNFLLMK